MYTKEQYEKAAKFFSRYSGDIHITNEDGYKHITINSELPSVAAYACETMVKATEGGDFNTWLCNKPESEEALYDIRDIISCKSAWNAGYASATIQYEARIAELKNALNKYNT